MIDSYHKERHKKSRHFGVRSPFQSTEQKNLQKNSDPKMRLKNCQTVIKCEQYNSTPRGLSLQIQGICGRPH